MLGCQTMQAAPLEDEGGSGTAGNHWEYRLFQVGARPGWVRSLGGCAAWVGAQPGAWSVLAWHGMLAKWLAMSKAPCIIQQHGGTAEPSGLPAAPPPLQTDYMVGLTNSYAGSPQTMTRLTMALLEDRCAPGASWRCL